MQKIYPVKITALFYFLFVQITFAQIEGTILNSIDKEPLVGANIQLIKIKAGAVSDINGNFVINVSNETFKADTLLVSYLGYQEFKKSVVDPFQKHIIYLRPVNLILGQDIVVIGERKSLARQEIPHAKEIISAEELQRYGSSELGDLVKKIPSIRIEGNDLDGRRVQIRGSNASEVNVYVDGVLINAINTDNSADLSIVSAEQIESLEILKGGNLPLIGQGAFGGVINVSTKRVLEPELKLKIKTGSFETQQFQASMNIPITKKLYIGYFGQSHKMNPDIEFFPSERFVPRTENTKIRTKRINHSASLDYFHSSGEFRTKYFNYNLDYQKPGWQNQKQTHLFSISYQDSSGLNIFLNRTNSTNNIERYLVSSTRTLYDYQTSRLNFRVSKNFKYKISNFQILSEYYHDELETESKIKDAESTAPFYSASLYDNRMGLAGIYAFTDKYEDFNNLNWRVFFGARGDFTASGNKDFSNSWGARLNYKKNNRELIPYISYGKNVKYPSLYQSAYIRDLQKYSNQSDTTTLLRPEYNNSYEAGFNYNIHYTDQVFSQIQFSTALFLNTTYNKILSRPFGEEIIQVQTGRNTTKGFEAALKIKQILEYLSLNIAYIKLDIDNPLLYEYKPEQSTSIQLESIFPFGLYLSGMFFYDGKSYAWYLDDTNFYREDKIPDSYDIDISLGYMFKWLGLQYAFQFAGYNILDNSSYDYYFNKKRYLQASLSIKY